MPGVRRPPVAGLPRKLAGVGDILKPIRTASYAMLTESTEAGSWRIVGAYSGASAFGGVSLVCPRGPQRPSDIEVLEMMIDLDGDVPLLPGMRVDAFVRK